MPHQHATDVFTEIAKYLLPSMKRVQRVTGYFVTTALFAYAAPYEINHPWMIAAGVGMLGGATQSARIGQAALFFFTAMAIVPKALVMAVASAAGLG